MSYFVEERRAYSTRQRPNPITIHGPFATREEAIAAMKVMARLAARNDNPSSYELRP